MGCLYVYLSFCLFFRCVSWAVGREVNTFRNLAPDGHLDFVLFWCLSSYLFLFRFFIWVIGRAINLFKNLVPDEHVHLVLFACFDLIVFFLFWVFGRKIKLSE